MTGAGALLAACASVQGPAPTRSPAAGLNGTMRPYEVNGTWYRPAIQPNYQKEGLASWYGAQFHNRRTADGEAFDMDRPSAAHTTLPLPCIVEVTNLENGRRLRVRVNDRGPFVGRPDHRSFAPGREGSGLLRQRHGPVRVRYIGPAPWRAGVVSRGPDASEDAQRAVRPARVIGAQVQAAAFADIENAERAAASLAAQGAATRDGSRSGRGEAVPGGCRRRARARTPRPCAAASPPPDTRRRG